MAFTLATWNILATAYIRREFYPRTPREVLNPVWRVPELARHAAALDVDILCLQEVETTVFKTLQSTLDPSGYSGTHALKGSNRPDGCATFFRRARFMLKHDQRIPYDDGSHIVQSLLFEHEGRSLAVLNTHLKWDSPDTRRERQWGYRQVLQAIEAVRDAPPAQIICGDFNVVLQSDVVQALLAAHFDYAHRLCPGVVTCNSNGQPKLIDYLFHSRSLLAEPIVPKPIDARTMLPSPDQPSDHLPLAAHFNWNYPAGDSPAEPRA